MKRALSVFSISLFFVIGADTKAKDIIDNAQGPQVGDQQRQNMIYVFWFSNIVRDVQQ